jgi:hypothetical protein
MSVTSQVRNFTLAAGAVTLVTGAAIAGTAVSASAAVPHKFKLCAYGNYEAFGIVEPSDLQTVDIPSGECASVPIGDGSTYAKVWGKYNTNHKVHFYVGTAHFSESKGWSGAAQGTTTNPSLRDFN